MMQILDQSFWLFESGPFCFFKSLARWLLLLNDSSLAKPLASSFCGSKHGLGKHIIHGRWFARVCRWLWRETRVAIATESRSPLRPLPSCTADLREQRGLPRQLCESLKVFFWVDFVLNHVKARASKIPYNSNREVKIRLALHSASQACTAFSVSGPGRRAGPGREKYYSASGWQGADCY